MRSEVTCRPRSIGWSRVAVERSLQNETDVWLLDSSRQARFTHGSDGALARLPLWSPDGARIAFESVRASTVTLSAKPTGEDDDDALFQTHRLGGGSNVIGRSHQYDVAVDGRFLDNLDAELTATPITLLLNWRP